MYLNAPRRSILKAIHAFNGLLKVMSIIQLLTKTLRKCNAHYDEILLSSNFQVSVSQFPYCTDIN